MKKLNAVRWAAFLMTLLANADVAETTMMDDHAIYRRHAKCERCGQTGPTIPIAPVVFRVGAAVTYGVPRAVGNASVVTAARNVLQNSTLPVLDEFGLDSARPAVGAAVSR